MPRSHTHGSPRRFHYGSSPTDDTGNDSFRSPIRVHNASTTTYDYGYNTEVYGLIRIATDDAGSYPWLILRQIRECVTWPLEPLYPYQAHYIHGLVSNTVNDGNNHKMSAVLAQKGILLSKTRPNSALDLRRLCTSSMCEHSLCKV